MITFITPQADTYTCVRHDHDHNENGRITPCAACSRVLTQAEVNGIADAILARNAQVLIQPEPETRS